LNAQAQLGKTGMSLDKAIGRLTSGLRINTAADDAAGMAIANRHKLDYSGLQTGIRSANDAISKLQIEDGAMNNISLLLDRAVTLGAQAASSTFLGSRTTLDTEFQSVLSEITRQATAAGLETGSVNLNARSIFVGNTQIRRQQRHLRHYRRSGRGVDASGAVAAWISRISLAPPRRNRHSGSCFHPGRLARTDRFWYDTSAVRNLTGGNPVCDVAAAESRLRVQTWREASNLTRATS
jgi:hypothetical protein